LISGENSGFYSTRHDPSYESCVGILLHYSFEEALSAANEAAHEADPDLLDDIEVGALVPMGRPTAAGEVECMAELRPEVGLAIAMAFAEFVVHCHAWLTNFPACSPFAHGAVDAHYSRFLQSVDVIFASGEMPKKG
jgi:hypothetical protein